MRLLIVSREFAPFHGWGAGTYASLMAEAMAGLGHDVHVLSHDSLDTTEASRLRSGVTFHTIDREDRFVRLPAFACEPQQYAYAVFRAASRLHDAHAFDAIEFPDFLGEGAFCIHARRSMGAFANCALGVRLHMTMRHIHELNHDDWFDVPRAVIENQERVALRGADVLLAPSDSMLAIVRERLGSACPPHAATLRLPFPLAQLRELGQTRESIEQRDAMNARTHDDASAPVVLCAGRFERRKGVHVLAQAMNILWSSADPRIARARVRFVGEDTLTGPAGRSMRAHIESIVPREHASKLEFLPRAGRGEIARMSASCTVACLPSLWENFPFTCLEALALGTPFVGSDQGGMAEIIQPERSGLLAKGGDPADLAHALSRMLTVPALRRTCSAGGPARVRELCDPEVIAMQATQHYERARWKPTRTTILPPASHKPLISVIVPVFNTHEHLHETLASVRNQTILQTQGDDAVEVLVIDDGSTRAETIAALDELERSEHARTRRGEPFRVRVVRIAHAGLSAARNAGLRESTGELVYPLDSDDMLEPTTLEKLANALHRTPSAGYATAYLRHFRHGASEPVGGWIALGGDADLLPVINAGSNAAMLMRRSEVLALGGYDESLPAYEDWDLCCRFAARRREGVVVPEFLLFYRLRDDSMMHTIDRARHERLRARILAKHGSLSTDPSRTLRLLQGDCVDMGLLNAPRGEAGCLVEHKRVFEAATTLLHENVRYRIADRLNLAAKRLGVQHAIKRLLNDR